MRNIEVVLAEMRSCAAAIKSGDRTAATLATCNAAMHELRKDHGIHVDTSAHDQRMAAQRGGSRFVGQGADLATVQALAAGGGVAERGSEPGQRSGSGRATLAGVMTKALAESTPSAGGVLVPAEVSNEILALIRNRTAVLMMGPTVVHVAKELDIPSFATGTIAQFTAENARLPVSDATFAIAPKLTPWEIGALMAVSNRVLRDAETQPSLEDSIRSDMADSLSVRLDLSFLDGTGNAQPLGIRGQAGTTPPMRSLGANGAPPTFDDLKGCVSALRAKNAPFRNPGWILSPRTLDGIERLKASDGRYLSESPNLLQIDPAGNTGKLLGFKFIVTGNVQDSLTVGTSTDTSYIVFSSDWQECWVGENLGLTIDASSEAAYSVDGVTAQFAFQQRQTVFRVQAAYDICLRRPEWFCVLSGVRPVVG